MNAWRVRCYHGDACGFVVCGLKDSGAANVLAFTHHKLTRHTTIVEPDPGPPPVKGDATGPEGTGARKGGAP